MFNKLQKKWQVGPLRLLLILTTFAIGGSLCGYTGRKLLALTTVEKGFLWITLYILIVSLLWPISILLVSIPLGQFFFFKKYFLNIFLKIRGKKNS